jgi:aminopeptidase
MFPDLSEDEAVARLWDAIFAATRADVDDPVGAWEAHLDALERAKVHLSAKGYAALRLRAPGTDLRLGLADGHVWESGGGHAECNGARFVANMPTEEVFTAPHAQRVDGVISSSKPLSYQGQLIDGFQLTFEGGAVTKVQAAKGQAALEKLLDIDDGARRLGEIALVPHGSPISQSGVLFYNTLFDENAACHVALGRAYETTMKDGTKRPLEELQRDGFNQSFTHVDFMFGSDQLDVDGETADGALEQVMRGGEWAF